MLVGLGRGEGERGCEGSTCGDLVSPKPDFFSTSPVLHTCP